MLVPRTALAEALQGSRKPAVLYALSRLELVPILEQDYRDAAQLMEATGMGGHAVDALVAAVARRQRRPVLIRHQRPHRPYAGCYSVKPALACFRFRPHDAPRNR